MGLDVEGGGEGEGGAGEVRTEGEVTEVGGDGVVAGGGEEYVVVASGGGGGGAEVRVEGGVEGEERESEEEEESACGLTGKRHFWHSGERLSVRTMR